MIIENFKELEKESLERGIPILGSVKGEWLLNKIKELKPKTILELGTANGYSGCILGSLNGELTTIEINGEIAKEAEANLEKFGINGKIIVGDGVEEIKKLDDEFDLIFIDFEKAKYVEILEDCIRLGKVIIADNVSFDNCKDFLDKIMNHPKLETEVIKVGDWMSLSVKQ
jgi:predicted O-methyltransferase YrrM